MSTPSNHLRDSRWTILVVVLLLTACAPNSFFSNARPASSPAARPTWTRTSPSALPSPAATTQIPTPQPTPGPGAYRLKAWSEQHAFDAIIQGEQLNPATDAQLPWDIQEYLFTLEREALLRFPNGKNKNELEWKYAREAAILQGSEFRQGAPGESFVPLLGQALDSGQVAPDLLEAWLPTKGFNVVSRHSAPNLLGDGQPVQVLQIETQDRLRPGEILLTISKSPQLGSYRLFSVRPSWLYRDSQRQTPEEVAIVSHTASERPEIQTVAESAWPAICESQLSLYRWRADASSGRFENVAEQVKPIEGDYRNSECRDPWEFGAPDARGAQPLTATLRHKNWAGDDCTEYEYKMRYEWDGTVYRWVRGGASLPDKSQPPQCFVGWAHAAAKHGLYDQAIPLVVSAIAQWPKELDSVWGPSAKDLFRFELGTWYAFQGDSDRAISTLEDVKGYRANPAFSMTPRMAETYLSTFRVSQDPDRSCVAVYNMLRQEFEQTPDDSRLASSGRTIAAWGFGEPDWDSRVPRLDEVCNHGWRPETVWGLQSPTATPEAPRLTPEPQPLTPEPTATPSPEMVQQQAIQAIEKTVFVDGDSRQGSQLIEQLLAAGVIEDSNPYGIETVKPYLRYLLGLAYELSGDERNAVDNYWRLQKDYPDSLYSRVAQQKMERIGP